MISLEYSEQSGGRRIPDDQLRFYIDQVNRSNWGFSQIKQDIAQSLGGGGRPATGGWNPGRGNGNDGRPGYPGNGNGGWNGNGRTIRCESADGRNRVCPTPWRGQSQLVRQLSKTDCREGYNWTSRRGEVTVWGGCRAEFAQGRGGGEVGTIRCESANNRVANCQTPWRGRSQVVRQISDTRCREGQNWSTRNGQVSVWSGCRAEFGPAGGGWGGGNNGYTVTCAGPRMAATPPATGRRVRAVRACLRSTPPTMPASKVAPGACRAKGTASGSTAVAAATFGN